MEQRGCEVGMKVRTAKKRIHRHISWFARHKIPKAFANGKDRRAWVKEISDYHIMKIKRRRRKNEKL